MVINMANQEYLMINKSTSIVDNICVWNGDVDSWQPSSDILMLEKSITPAMIWQLDNTLSTPAFVLKQEIGDGNIGFVWNGTVLTTNQPQPSVESSTEQDAKASALAKLTALGLTQAEVTALIG